MNIVQGQGHQLIADTAGSVKCNVSFNHTHILSEDIVVVQSLCIVCWVCFCWCVERVNLKFMNPSKLVSDSCWWWWFVFVRSSVWASWETSLGLLSLPWKDKKGVGQCLRDYLKMWICWKDGSTLRALHEERLTKMWNGWVKLVFCPCDVRITVIASLSLQTETSSVRITQNLVVPVHSLLCSEGLPACSVVVDDEDLFFFLSRNPRKHKSQTWQGLVCSRTLSLCHTGQF